MNHLLKGHPLKEFLLIEISLREIQIRLVVCAEENFQQASWNSIISLVKKDGYQHKTITDLLIRYYEDDMKWFINQL